MASFLSKFARGASAAGGQLYMDQYMQEQRATIMAQRDSTLNKHRMDATTKEQEFRSSEAEKSRIAAAGSPQTKLAEMKLTQAVGIEDLKTRYTNATTDKEKKSIVEEAMISLGVPFGSAKQNQVKLTADERIVNAQVKAGVHKTKKEAWAALKDNTKDLSVPIFNALVEANESLSMKPEDKLSIEQIFEKVQLLTGVKEEEEEKEDKFIKGSIYEDSISGMKKRYGGNGIWEEI